MDLLAVASASRHGRGGRRGDGEHRRLTINLFWIIVAAAELHPVLRGLPGLLQAVTAMLDASPGPDRAGADGRRAGAARPRERPRPSGRRRSPRPAARRRRSSTAPRRSPRRPATRRSPRPARSSSGCATQAVAEIDAEKQRALADLRAQVADLALAAAGKVVGETMSDQRQRRLVEEFLHEATGDAGGANG